MILQIRAKLLPIAILLILVGQVFLTARSSRAADDCISKPDTAPPAGSHWYYRVDRNHRQCWYLAAEGANGRPHQQQTASTSRSPSPPKPALPPAPPETLAAAAAPAPAAVRTEVIKASAEDNSATQVSLVETSGLGRPEEIFGRESFIERKRADQAVGTEITDGPLSAGLSLATASDVASAEQPGLFEITFVHLV